MFKLKSHLVKAFKYQILLQCSGIKCKGMDNCAEKKSYLDLNLTKLRIFALFVNRLKSKNTLFVRKRKRVVVENSTLNLKYL